MKQGKIRIIIDEIFRVVIINMYFTHSIPHSVNYDLIRYKQTCTELMRKAFQLGRSCSYFSQEQLCISTKLGTKHPCVKGTHLPREDNSEIAKLQGHR